MIRLATYHDIPELVAVCKPFYDEIAFGCLNGCYDPAYVWDTFIPCNGENAVLVVNVEDKIINGVFYALINRQSLYQNQVPVAEEIIWHVSPDMSGYRRIKIMDMMLKFAEPHLKSKGARLLSIGTRLDNNAAGKLLENRAYKETGRRFYKEFTP